MCCSAFWCNTPHKSPRQRHCPYLVHAEQGSTCRNCCDDIYCSAGGFRFPAIFYCCRNWLPSTKGSCSQLYWYHFVQLPSSSPLACQMTCTVLRDFCLQGEMQLFCGGNPLSWPLGCQHRSIEMQSSVGMGRGWLAAGAVTPVRARVISSCSSNSELVCSVFLMYSLGQHHKACHKSLFMGSYGQAFFLACKCSEEMAQPFYVEISFHSTLSNALHGQQPQLSCKWGGQGVILPGLALQVVYIWPVMPRLKMDFAFFYFG